MNIGGCGGTIKILQKRREINRMPDRSNTQKGKSNTGRNISGSKGNKSREYSTFTEKSAVHNPVPGKGGKGGKGK